MAIPVVLPKIALEAAAIVAPPTVTLDLVIESDPEIEPSESPPSPDYSDPLEDESEPIKDAPEEAEPLSAQDVTIMATIEPTILPIHHRLSVEERLDEQSEMIGGMYEHLLDMPMFRIKEIEKELQTLRDRVVSSERDNTSLHARVRAAELSDDSTRVALQTARTGLA
ncbi:hypothetical protein Tco_1206839 [Tanacetum coccineum]